MNRVKTEIDLKKAVATAKTEHRSIGFVPTMGALHEGHLSLVRASRRNCDFTVVSIFVNPTQFNEPQDLLQYPRTLEQDLELLEEEGCQIAFFPGVEEVYPNGKGEAPVFDFGSLESKLEGAHRPGHFKGVGQVVARLLEMVQPDTLFLGQKDYQQYLVLKMLVDEILKAPIEVVLCPIVREPDGLAMSSRNKLLRVDQRKDAIELSKTLLWIKENLDAIHPLELKEGAVQRLRNVKSIVSVDYIEIADAETLEPCDTLPKAGFAGLALGAIQMEDIRLIDNVRL